MDADFDMVKQRNTGRTFSAVRKVRLGDVTPSGRLRLDALNRYTQDVSNDDTTDVGLSEATAWVVRRTCVDVHQPARMGEQLTLTTFAGALGRRWADRRITVVGVDGARYEVATLWIHLDPVNGRPLGLTDEFLAIYGEAAGDRTVSARRSLQAFDPAVGERRGWPTRAVDFDPQQHMNNAAYWAVFEELLAEASRPDRLRATIEYAGGIALDASVELAIHADADTTRAWWLAGPRNGDYEVAASGSIAPLPASA